MKSSLSSRLCGLAHDCTAISVKNVSDAYEVLRTLFLIYAYSLAGNDGSTPSVSRRCDEPTKSSKKLLVLSAV